MKSGSTNDGTTGTTGPSGRRTHIIQILRDSKRPLTAREVADKVDIHLNTARFHLQNLVEAGLAERSVEQRTVPGRPKTLYMGTLPNQTHERAQGYRLLAEILTTAVTQHVDDAPEMMRSVGREWGRYLTPAPAPFERLSDDEARTRLVAKMDALWFAPEISDDPEPELVMHNCPFLTLARRVPEVVCSLHAGLVNGSLQELGSSLRAVEVLPLNQPHTCRVVLARMEGRDPGDVTLTYDPTQMGPRATVEPDPR